MYITDEGLKNLSAAVIAQAVKDYRKDPCMRESIERWIINGNVWCDISLPNMEPNDIIGGLKKYAETQDETESAKKRIHEAI